MQGVISYLWITVCLSISTGEFISAENGVARTYTLISNFRGQLRRVARKWKVYECVGAKGQKANWKAVGICRICIHWKTSNFFFEIQLLCQSRKLSESQSVWDFWKHRMFRIVCDNVATVSGAKWKKNQIYRDTNLYEYVWCELCKNVRLVEKKQVWRKLR